MILDSSKDKEITFDEEESELLMKKRKTRLSLHDSQTLPLQHKWKQSQNIYLHNSQSMKNPNKISYMKANTISKSSLITSQLFTPKFRLSDKIKKNKNTKRNWRAHRYRRRKKGRSKETWLLEEEWVASVMLLRERVFFPERTWF